MNSDAKRVSDAKERFLTALHAVDQDVRNYADELKVIQEQGSADRFDSLAEVLSEAARPRTGCSGADIKAVLKDITSSLCRLEPEDEEENP